MGRGHRNSRRRASRHFRGINEPPLRATPHVFHACLDAVPCAAVRVALSPPPWGSHKRKRHPMTKTSTLTKADLRQFTGSEHWYRHALNGKVFFTDGAQYVAD